MKIIAPAKINLALDVLKKTSSGYHEIKTIVQQVDDLFDEIEIVESEKDEFLCEIPREKNLAYKAMELLRRGGGLRKFARIAIKKNIPISSGLGGGSSNAAATLLALNKIWELNLSTIQLIKIAGKLGSDVPFFLHGKTALLEGFGEKITPLPSIDSLKFQVFPATSPDPQKTANQYAKLNLADCGKNQQKTTEMLKAIKENNSEKILQNLHNDFETIMPVTQNHHLSGSGPSTFSAEISG